MEYNKETDKKWQNKWKEDGLYKYDPNSSKEKFYTMEMFSYPSGANLHLGHWFNFAPADSFARFKAMQGKNVFHPMGFDAFGLPAENYAIKTGIHPQDSTIKNIETMKRQLDEMGATYDWDYSVETCMPEYYKWTQWIFTQLYKNGLAYKKEAPVNWCNGCNTVLANEQVVDCKCERCGTPVERKKLKQWFFKTTEYAEELLEGLKDLDWPEETKKIQTNWIGRSEGAEIKFKADEQDVDVNVFTTRPETLNGVSYVVIAPESELALQLTKPEYLKEVKEYREKVSKVSEIDRMSTEREKTGVFTGSYVINPINGEKVPVWLSDYVVEGYGTGAVMAVPAHDERDFEFAKKYGLKIKPVIQPKNNDENILPYTGGGKLINSGKFDGLSTSEAKKQIVETLGMSNDGKETVNYKLKDWLVSRQRYWGSPIPIVYCPECGTVPVPEEQLPVKLPYDVEFKPDGESPLKKSSEYMNCQCPNCGGPATREADTLDTFVCSSWYFLRYPDANNSEKAWDRELINKMLPVDMYVGGKEHAAMHLIYARFMTKALRDMGYLDFDEPFKKLIHQGMILGPDGNKMSKSKGNTVSPDTYIDKYGSDTFRMYLMFGFDFTKGGPWDDKGIEAISRYLGKIERLINTVIENKETAKDSKLSKEDKNLLRVKNLTIQSMSTDMDNFQFNTAIARSMELLNKMNAYLREGKTVNYELLRDTLETFIKLIAPIAPHFAEEQWEKLGHEQSIHKEEWPIVNKQELQGGLKSIPIQINGKLRTCIKVDEGLSPDEILEVIKSDPRISEILQTYDIKREIYVPGKIYNLVVNQQKKDEREDPGGR